MVLCQKEDTHSMIDRWSTENSFTDTSYMKNGTPEVDFVLLSWNRAEMTIDTIRSICSQENIKPVIWVIDQGSEGPQLELLKDFIYPANSIHLIELGKNLGVPGGRNLGMKLGNARFIVCIDNDAIFASPHEIEKILQKFAESDRLAIIGFKIDNYFSKSLDLGSWVYPKQLIAKKNEEFLATRFCGAGHAIRRSALERTNFYDERLFFYWEELDLAYQMINLGFTVLYSPEIRVLHKVSNENRIQWSGDRYYYLVRNKIYLDWKYRRSFSRLLVMSLGYMSKAVYNRVLSAYFRAVVDAVQMIKQVNPSKEFILTKDAREYIRFNDLSYRGNIFQRILKEVFSKLPSEK